MKKILVTIAMVLGMVANAQAHYCDNRGERCFQNAAQVNIDMVKKTYRAIMTSGVNDNYKGILEADQNKWGNSVDRQCRSYACVANSAWDRYMFLANQQAKIKKMKNQ